MSDPTIKHLKAAEHWAQDGAIKEAMRKWAAQQERISHPKARRSPGVWAMMSVGWAVVSWCTSCTNYYLDDTRLTPLMRGECEACFQGRRFKFGLHVRWTVGR